MILRVCTPDADHVDLKLDKNGYNKLTISILIKGYYCIHGIGCLIEKTSR